MRDQTRTGMPANDGVWQIAPAVAHVDAAEGVYVLTLDHRRAGAPRLLSGPGATIWRAIDGLTSTSEIVAQLGASFGGVSSQIAHDVAAFVDELYGHGYLIPAASGARRS